MISSPFYPRPGRRVQSPLMLNQRVFAGDEKEVAQAYDQEVPQGFFGKAAPLLTGLSQVFANVGRMRAQPEMNANAIPYGLTSAQATALRDQQLARFKEESDAAYRAAMQRSIDAQAQRDQEQAEFMRRRYEEVEKPQAQLSQESMREDIAQKKLATNVATKTQDATVRSTIANAEVAESQAKIAKIRLPFVEQLESAAVRKTLSDADLAEFNLQLQQKFGEQNAQAELAAKAAQTDAARANIAQGNARLQIAWQGLANERDSQAFTRKAKLLELGMDMEAVKQKAAMDAASAEENTLQWQLSQDGVSGGSKDSGGSDKLTEPGATTQQHNAYLYTKLEQVMAKHGIQYKPAQQTMFSMEKLLTDALHTITTSGNAPAIAAATEIVNDLMAPSSTLVSTQKVPNGTLQTFKLSATGEERSVVIPDTLPTDAARRAWAQNVSKVLVPQFEQSLKELETLVGDVK